MKKLKLLVGYALCMLLPVFVFCDAQAQIKDTLYQITCDGDTTGRYFVFERGKMPIEIAMQNIVQLMFEYETECYNDSTYVKYIVDYTPHPETKNDTLDLTGVYATIALYSEAAEWRHKEPTFQDFVRWVRKKYCR